MSCTYPYGKYGNFIFLCRIIARLTSPSWASPSDIIKITLDVLEV
ncbi:hypothetical protein [Apibacter sp. B3706]|nr:hypothetical protein [Apibacter sp. B3706]